MMVVTQLHTNTMFRGQKERVTLMVFIQSWLGGRLVSMRNAIMEQEKAGLTLCQ